MYTCQITYYIYIYIHIYIYICDMYAYIYIHIHRERERDIRPHILDKRAREVNIADSCFDVEVRSQRACKILRVVISMLK